MWLGTEFHNFGAATENARRQRYPERDGEGGLYVKKMLAIMREKFNIWTLLEI